MTPLKVLLVEDDHLQASLISDTLERAFPYITVEQIRTENEFRSRINKIKSSPPDIVVMDVMLKWTNPSRELVEPPPTVREGGYAKAGLRCVEMLAGQEDLKHIPVILFTVLSFDDLESLPDGILYLSKESPPDELVGRIRSAVT